MPRQHTAAAPAAQAAPRPTAGPVPLAVLASLAMLAPLPALAYVGPGAGVSLIGSVLGLIAAIGTAIGFILLWPIRAFLRKRKARSGGGGESPPGGAPQP